MAVETGAEGASIYESTSAAEASNGNASRFVAAEMEGTKDAAAVLGPKEKDSEVESAVMLPLYLQAAIAGAVSSIGAPVPTAQIDSGPRAAAGEAAPKAPLLVFFNSRSGGGMGPVLNKILRALIGSAQVFDLSKVDPGKVLAAVLPCLKALADSGDIVAKESLQRLRLLVAGGDGTVGWLLSSIPQIPGVPPPPVGVIPLGTGNDLARSFGWGAGFTSASRQSVKKRLLDVASAAVTQLDGWEITVLPPPGTDKASLVLPHAMHPQHRIPLEPQPVGDNGEPIEVDGAVEAPNAFAASFYNYFSLGMDAQIAYGFHHLREDNPWLARGGVANKAIYSTFGCTQGWFCASCSPQPRRRSVSGVATVYIMKEANGAWEELHLPWTLRAIIVLNLQSYAGGRNLWGRPSAKKVEQEKWAEPRVNDGRLEIVGLHDGWHTAVAMSGLSTAKHLAQVFGVKVELRGSVSKKAYMQLDGEPWLQPLVDPQEPTIVEILPIPRQSVLLAAANAQVLK